ncbi:hypothetical protein BT69DRAFT_607406 [Atractiella rhizophila]|nr:hypothetical protein BT69DRAFT_607406 [Atractiella rhizophila]
MEHYFRHYKYDEDPDSDQRKAVILLSGECIKPTSLAGRVLQDVAEGVQESYETLMDTLCSRFTNYLAHAARASKALAKISERRFKDKDHVGETMAEFLQEVEQWCRWGQILGDKHRIREVLRMIEVEDFKEWIAKMWYGKSEEGRRMGMEAELSWREVKEELVMLDLARAEVSESYRTSLYGVPSGRSALCKKGVAFKAEPNEQGRAAGLGMLDEITDRNTAFN